MSETLLRIKQKVLQKLIAVTGGFLILIGIILFGIAFLSLFGYLDVSILLERKYWLIFALTMVVVGLLDTFTALIIARW